jgi:hypothetical protein
MKLMKTIFASSLLLVNVAFAQPTNIQLEYEVSRNESPFGTVKESYVQEGVQYRIASTTKGKGLYALLGSREMTSKGTVTAEGLVPEKFQFKRGSSASKTLSTSFNWASHQLSMLVKGKTRVAKLLPRTVDLVSYPYQFMFTPLDGNQVKIALTTGKKLKQYTYKVVARDVMLNVGGTQYKTLHLVNTAVGGEKKKELWLAEETHYIPVKYLVVDKDGEKIEQVLTKISME